MGKSTKPWLNYKSHEDLEASYQFKLERKVRKYKTAMLYLIFLGFTGGHKFYLYDEMHGWKILGGYVAIVIVAGFLKPILEVAPMIAFICYAVAIILTAYPNLRAHVDRINREIEND